MHLRINFARFLIELGTFIQSLSVLVMRPDDLVEFSRKNYERPEDLRRWSGDATVDSGLDPDELELLAAVPQKSGNLLLLGIGGGREAIPLSRMGFRVTGIDYVPEMVNCAMENASHRGIEIEGLVQDISTLNVSPNNFDVVWLSRRMYSCIPTRRRRVEMVRRIALSLKSEGLFLCQFQINPNYRLSRMSKILRRFIAVCSLGNTAFEEGDILWENLEFLHVFKSLKEIQSELEAGGLAVKQIQADPNTIGGGAICVKIPLSGNYTINN